MTKKKITSILLAICLVIIGSMPFTVSAATAPKLGATSKTIYVGDSYTVSVSGTKITSKSFKTSNKAVATVSSKGVVKAIKNGTATITATVKYKSGSTTKTKKLACKITVKAFVTPTASPTSKTIYVGNSFTMSKSGTHIQSVSYATSNKAVATVSTKGVVKGIKAGTATITATIKYKQAGKDKTKKVACKVTVKKKPVTTSSSQVTVKPTTTIPKTTVAPTKPVTQTSTKPNITTTQPKTTHPVTDDEGYNNQILKP